MLAIGRLDETILSHGNLSIVFSVSRTSILNSSLLLMEYVRRKRNELEVKKNYDDDDCNHNKKGIQWIMIIIAIVVFIIIEKLKNMEINMRMRWGRKR